MEKIAHKEKEKKNTRPGQCNQNDSAEELVDLLPLGPLPLLFPLLFDQGLDVKLSDSGHKVHVM